MFHGTARNEPLFEVRFEISYVDYEGGVGRRSVHHEDCVEAGEVVGYPAAVRMLLSQVAAWGDDAQYVSAVVDDRLAMGREGRMLLLSSFRDEAGGCGWERLRVEVVASPLELEHLRNTMESEGLVVKEEALAPWTRPETSLSSTGE